MSKTSFLFDQHLLQARQMCLLIFIRSQAADSGFQQRINESTNQRINESTNQQINRSTDQQINTCMMLSRRNIYSSASSIQIGKIVALVKDNHFNQIFGENGIIWTYSHCIAGKYPNYLVAFHY